MIKLLLFFCCILFSILAYSQDPASIIKSRLNGGGSSNTNYKKGDSTKKTNTKLDTLGFERRDDLADSITISFRYVDSLKKNPLDSSINDFDKYYSVPSSYQYLGNNGAAAFPLIFKPLLKTGWDAGFHAFDIYKYNIENTKFYKTTGPFTSLGYQLASGKEQMIQAFHTQSPRQNINVGFEYRLISAPGFFITQNNNHNNLRLFSTYAGKRKRYNASFILISNNIKASQNGGIVDDDLLQDPNKKERVSIVVRLGNLAKPVINPFQANITTGNVYKEKIFYLRQSYDIGKRDSIAINDSTKEYLFYPKLRLQHTLTMSSNSFNFSDPIADSIYYKNYYNIALTKATDSFQLDEKWQSIINDFSLVQFPDTKNIAQFFLAGVSLQTLKLGSSKGDFNFQNVMLHAEYRNRTRNKLWDILLKGEFNVAGYYAADYNAQASLSRFLNKKLGNVNVFFTNVSRSPSFIFNTNSSFNFNSTSETKKENIIAFGAKSNNAFIEIGFNNYLINNYSYFTNFYKTDQYSKPINILQIFASKKIKVRKNIFYYIEATAQQTDNASPIKLPLLFTRSRIAYEGSIYKNLKLSTGLEVRYYTAYKANNFSPILGQFVAQDTTTIYNKPDITAFLNFRIKNFSAYLRAENLNTTTFKNGFSFTDNNFAAPHYPTQAFAIRFGIRWWFVK